MTSVIDLLWDILVLSLSAFVEQIWSHFGNPRSQLEGRNTDYSMYSTFLTSSPGSVLFNRSNLLKRKVLSDLSGAFNDLFRILRIFILSYFRQFQYRIAYFADYIMYSTFLTASPRSVLFTRSNLLKRKDLCFSCLRIGLIRHRRSLRSSHLSSQVIDMILWLSTLDPRSQLEGRNAEFEIGIG